MLTVIGEALLDLVDAGDQSVYAARPGGSPLNVAVGAARLGLSTALLARLAPDAFGRVLRRHATSNGVDVSACPVASEQATLAVVSLDEQRHASYQFYVQGTADWQWTENELRTLPAGTTILHTGSLAAWTPPGDACIAALAARTHASNQVIVSYDPNVRPPLLGDPGRAQALIERNVAVSHVVKASDEDLRWLYPGRGMADIAAGWLALGPHLVVVTSGANGAVAYRGGTAPLGRPTPAVPVVDTVGAGDAFTAGLLVALSGRATPATLPTLDDAALTAVLDHAMLVAALTCGRAGADPPTAAEVAAARSSGLQRRAEFAHDLDQQIDIGLSRAPVDDRRA